MIELQTYMATTYFSKLYRRSQNQLFNVWLTQLLFDLMIYCPIWHAAHFLGDLQVHCNSCTVFNRTVSVAYRKRFYTLATLKRTGVFFLLLFAHQAALRCTDSIFVTWASVWGGRTEEQYSIQVTISVVHSLS